MEIKEKIVLLAAVSLPLLSIWEKIMYSLQMGKFTGRVQAPLKAQGHICPPPLYLRPSPLTPLLENSGSAPVCGGRKTGEPD